MNDHPHTILVCALPSEAQPLLARYNPGMRSERPFRIYRCAEFDLVISGIGAGASAAAVGYAAASCVAHGATAWINFGIAGHAGHALGTAVLAAKVTQHGSAAAWYPSLLFTPPCTVGTVTTFAEPVTTYPTAACCDMEAAGFMAATQRVANGDLVQVLKFVSDNAAAGLAQLDRTRIAGYISTGLPVLEALIERTRDVAARLPRALPARELEALTRNRHFTHAERLQLATLARRHAALAPDAAWPGIDLAACRDAAEILSRIRRRVDSLLPDAGPPV